MEKKTIKIRKNKFFTDVQRIRRYKLYLELKEEFEPKKKRKKKKMDDSWKHTRDMCS